MKILRNIKKHIGSFWLKRKKRHVKRDVIATNLKEASSVGVIFNIMEDKEEFDLIRKFLIRLNQSDHKIYTLGFFDGKTIPVFLGEEKSINLFTRQDLNGLYLPKRTFINEFIQQPYDILIDLSQEETLPLKYVSALSQAKFKVGLFKEKEASCDFMIHLNGNATTEKLINNIEHYISTIKVK